MGSHAVAGTGPMVAHHRVEPVVALDGDQPMATPVRKPADGAEGKADGQQPQGVADALQQQRRRRP